MDSPEQPSTRDELADHREEVLRLLQRAASALIDAEENGPTWIGYGAALKRARAFKAQADSLNARRRERR